MDQLILQAQNLFEYSQKMRRDFHQHPELGFEEVRTAGIVAEELDAIGLEVTSGIAKTGVIGVIRGSGPGPVVMLRFDMDALPITEQTNAEYSSLNPGVMHACGHDGHTAIGLTVARLLFEKRNKFCGEVKLVFQPAEEGMGGAEQMVAEGVLENPTPDVAVGLHLWNERSLGWLGISTGPTMAASEDFSIYLKGKGGHGAAPHLTVDPVITAAHIITALQTIVSRNVAPLLTAVISVTTIHSGDAFNVIPSDAEMTGTIRTFDPVVRDQVLERFTEITNRTAEAFNCEVEVEVRPVTPAVNNDSIVSSRIRDIAKKCLPDNEINDKAITMGSEDMAFLMQTIPGCYIFIGSASEEKGLNAPHHHPCFDFDEQVLPSAVALLSGIALDYLS